MYVCWLVIKFTQLEQGRLGGLNNRNYILWGLKLESMTKVLADLVSGEDALLRP